MKRNKEYLGKNVDVIIDRPLGSKHPRHDFYYPINYGYIPNTIAGDGEEIDAYVLGELSPITKFSGVVIGIIARENDNEDKLVVADSINRYSKEQIEALTEFQEKYFKSEIFCYDYLKQSIRPTAKAIIRRNESILLIEEIDENPLNNYFRLPGGGIDFQELSRNAIEREIKEELDSNVTEHKLLTVLENPFEVKGIKAHEICFLYDLRVNEELYNKDLIEITEDTITTKAFWVEKSKIKEKAFKLYPEAVKEFI